MSKLYLYGAIALALLLAGIGLAYGVYHHAEARYAAGVQDGRNAVIAEDAAAAATAKVQQDIRDAASAQAGATLQHTLTTRLPVIQAQAHDAIDTIRTVYRDRPVPADACTRPDRVQQTLDAAVRGANAAPGGDL